MTPGPGTERTGPGRVDCQQRGKTVTGGTGGWVVGPGPSKLLNIASPSTIVLLNIPSVKSEFRHPPADFDSINRSVTAELAADVVAMLGLTLCSCLAQILLLEGGHAQWKMVL